MLVNCSYCNKELKRKPSQVKKNNHQFCNKDCFGKWKSENIKGENHPMFTRIKVNCSQCGEPIEIKKYQFEQNTNHFCSRECMGKWNSLNKVGVNHPLYTSLEKICNYCGEPYTIKSYRNDTSLYCSDKCKRESKKNKVETFCVNCGTEITKVPSAIKENNFCSNKCVGEWNGKQRDQKLSKTCIICGEEYKVQPALAEKSVTCSVDCQKKWQSQYYYKRPEVLEFRRQVAIKNIANQKSKDTKPERIVKEFLIKNNIDYIPQHPMYNKFVVDFYLPKKDIIIEVLGDYWHGNPEKYGEGKKPLSEKQKKTQEKDRKRFKYLQEKNHLIFGIWECDIYQDIEKSMSFLF